MVRSGGVEPWRALKVAARCAEVGLSCEAAQWVDRQLCLTLGGLGWTRAVRCLEGLIVKADPALAAERARLQRERRHVMIGDHRDGSAEVFARLDSEDAHALDATLGRIAQALADEQNRHDSWAVGAAATLDQRRATALGILADPEAAVDLLNGVGSGRPRNRHATVFVHIAADAVYGAGESTGTSGEDSPQVAD